MGLSSVFWQLEICGIRNNVLSRRSQCCVNTFKSVVRVLSEAGVREGGVVTKSVLCKHFQVDGRNIR